MQTGRIVGFLPIRDYTQPTNQPTSQSVSQSAHASHLAASRRIERCAIPVCSLQFAVSEVRVCLQIDSNWYKLGYEFLECGNVHR